MIKVSWTQLKTNIDSGSFNYNYIKDDNSYTVTATNGSYVVSCVILISDPASEEQSDFETNYLSGANSPANDFVTTALEKNDKDLKMAMLKADTDPLTGIAIVEIKCPGTPGVDKEGRYIMGAEAFFTSADPLDKVFKAEVVDVDNIMGYGAGAVLKSYHDDEVPEENQGWTIGVDNYDATGNGSFIEVKPLGGYAFIPAGLYLRITAVKDPVNKKSTFFANLLWGRYAT